MSAACRSAEAAIRTYSQTAGSTWYSDAVAASQAGYEMGMAMTLSNSGTSGKVGSDLLALYNDFEDLYAAAMEQDTVRYSAVAATGNTDIKVLWADCSTG
jgi:hypothetical protein